jgi:hypothetical protein
MMAVFGVWRFIHEPTGTFSRPIVGSGEHGYPGAVDHLNDFCLVMGHLTSRHSGEPERIALQWSYHNQSEGWWTERLGTYVDRGDALDILGVPVERRTAMLMETSGLLPPGTVATARAHPGFRIEDWSVSGTPAGDFVWTRRTPD